MNGAMFYFSGTGNSKYIAERFSTIMKIDYNQTYDVYSIEENIDFQRLIEKNSIVGFCYPIYGSCVPKIMRAFVTRHKEFLINKKIIIFCTQLLFSGDGSRTFTDIIKDIPVEVILAEHFNMPNNLCNLPLLIVKNGDEIRKKIMKAEKRLKRACTTLYENRIFLRGFNAFSHGLGLMQRPSFYKFEEKEANNIKIDHQRCTVCANCVRECPTDNLFINDKAVNSRGLCTLCYRCVNHCPQKAITVWIHRRVSKQYEGVV